MPADLYRESFKRNLGLLSEAEQETLRNTRVSIAGLGGVGGIHLVTLARIGFGRFSIADNDTFEAVNFNRQYGATTATIGRPKTEVMAEAARAINPEAVIDCFPRGIDSSNIDAFLEGSSFAIDAVDFFAIDARRLLFRKAREKGIWAATSGPIGFGSTLQVFSPVGMTFDEYFGIEGSMSYLEQMIAFSVGLTPHPLHLKYMDLSRVDLRARTGPSIASACALSAGLIATEAVAAVLDKRPVLSAPHYFQFDPMRQVYRKGVLRMGGRNPAQRLKRWFLMKRIRPQIEAAGGDTGRRP